jgi:hypothetical protein
MVHEITHILQGAARHSQTGIMKAYWTDHDLLQMPFRPLSFETQDIDLLHRGLARRESLMDKALVAGTTNATVPMR